ncbi:MATE family efflux transporter [Synergistales bacterium]|nr:MATE family efflux transporter [Synergistales bacterium]
MMKKAGAAFTENKMGVMPVNKLLLSVSVPIIVSMLVQSLYNIVDSIFVAHLGEDALTAVSLAFPIQMLMIGVATGTGVGINSFLSRSLGEKNYDHVNKAALNGIFLSWVSSAVFCVFGFVGVEAFFRSQTDIEAILNLGCDYLSIVCVFSFAVFNQVTAERLLISTGRTIYSMLSQILGALTNIILDPIMIFGFLGCPAMGVKGAAIATVIGQTAAVGAAIYFNVTKNPEIKLSPKGFRPSIRIIKNIYAVGLPSIIMGSLGSVMTYMLNLLLMSFTPTAVAIFGVYFKLQSFVFMPIFGLNNGMVPIVAYNYGAKKKARIIETVKLSVMYAVLIMLLGTAIFEIFPEALLALFDASDDMYAIGVPALRIISTHYFFAAFCIVSLSVFQALGSGAESLIVVIARQFALLLPIAWSLSLSGDVNSIWWTFPITEFVTLLLAAFLMKRVYDRKIRTM